MSVHVLSWVLKHSEETLGRRLVLLVLADHAKEDGTCAWPSVETIATEARLSERQARYALRGLEEAGSITCTGRTKKGTRVYSVNMGGANIAPLEGDRGAIYDTVGGQPIAPEPSLEPSYREEPNGSSLAPRPRNELWDALTELFGEPATRSAQTLRGKICKSLEAAGAESADVLVRARAWPRHFDNATLTEAALEKHWHTLAQTPMRLEERRGRSLRATG